MYNYEASRLSESCCWSQETLGRGDKRSMYEVAEGGGDNGKEQGKILAYQRWAIVEAASEAESPCRTSPKSSGTTVWFIRTHNPCILNTTGALVLFVHLQQWQSLWKLQWYGPAWPATSTLPISVAQECFHSFHLSCSSAAATLIKQWMQGKQVGLPALAPFHLGLHCPLQCKMYFST